MDAAQLNQITAEVDRERRRWYAALSVLGDLEGLAPEVVGEQFAAQVAALTARHEQMREALERIVESSGDPIIEHIALSALKEPNKERTRSASSEDLREELAALCHAQWSGWMRHLFSLCETFKDAAGKPLYGPFVNAVIIPGQLSARWKRQMNTRYADLGEAEQESDRKEADRILAITSVSEAERAVLNDVSSGLQAENERLKEVVAAQSLRLQQVEQLVAKWRQEATDGDTEERFYKDQCADELAEKLALSAPENPQ